MTATGKILRKFEKRGRHYVQWEGSFNDVHGQPIATLLNTFHVPE